MLKNYLKVALRSLAANKLYTFINIFALSVAMAFAVVAYLNFQYDRDFDRFHEQAESIYVARSTTLVAGREHNWGVTPRPLGPALARDFPQVEKMARVVYSLSALSYGDKIFNEVTYYVDEDFLEMFTLPLQQGTSAVIRDKSKLIISEALAHKYFGEDDALGKQVTIHFGDGRKRDFLVGGVLAPIPSNSSLQFDVLIPYAALQELNSSRSESWAEWSHETFIQVGKPEQVEAMADQLDHYVAAQNAANENWKVTRFYFDPFIEAAARARALTNDILKEGMHPAALVSPTVIAILLLLTACFNFMNTSLAYSALRLKEVGVRKVLGGVRRQLVFQFIGENILLCTIALIIAVVLAEFLVPGYSNLWREVDLQLDYRANWGLLAFLAGLLAFMSITAGAYPAMYVSRFNPVTILKGKQRLGHANWLMRGILTFQFALSTLTIFAGIVFTHNGHYFEQLDMGYEARQVVAVPLQGQELYTPLLQAAQQNPDILSIAGSRHQVGFNQSTLLAQADGVKHQVAVLSVGENYLETMDMRLLQGRAFDVTLASDWDRAVIINQQMARDFGWSAPLGQEVTIDSLRFTVIGVVQDFYNRSVWRPLQASALRLVKPEQYRYFVARVELRNLAATNDYLREAWHRLAPNIPYEGFYQDESIAEAMEVSSSIRILCIYISLAAIAIAAMGLFALSSLIIIRRTKEIGVRKVLGAGVLHVVALLNRQIVAVLLIAAVVAAAAGYFTLGALLDSIFAYHIAIQSWHMALAAAIVLAIGLVTVSSQVFRVATANPVQALRYE